MQLIFSEIEILLCESNFGFLVDGEITLADLFIFHELLNVITISGIKPEIE